MSQRRRRTWIAACALWTLALSGARRPAAGQVKVGDVVFKETLLRRLPPDSLFDQQRELVKAETAQMSMMQARVSPDGVHGGTLANREVFVALHARRGRGSDAFDQGVAAVRVDDRFRVLLVAEMDPGLGYVERLETLSPPSDGTRVQLLHVRYAQTGSGGVTEDRLYALDASDKLVDVPIATPDLSSLLQQGESLCCARFTSFDQDVVEQTVYVTRDGRQGISDRVRVRYGLAGSFRLDEARQQYVPDFRLVVQDVGGRESAR